MVTSIRAWHINEYGEVFAGSGCEADMRDWYTRTVGIPAEHMQEIPAEYFDLEDEFYCADTGMPYRSTLSKEIISKLNRLPAQISSRYVRRRN